MRPIVVASLDQRRPVVVLTRELVRPYLRRVTVAPVTGTIRGLSTEVLVGRRNGLERDSVVSCDDITTIDIGDLGDQIGWLLPDQEVALSAAISTALDLE